MKMKLVVIWILVWICFGIPAEATHIVGGELTYKCLGPGPAGTNTTIYQIRLDIYQDCLTGAPGAIAEDNPAFVRIFEYGTNSVVTFDSIFLNGNVVRVPPNFNNACVNNPPFTCLQRSSFISEYILPNNATGYRVVYQRCCRNQTIVNIRDPGATGATYFCMIPPVNPMPCNNSAVFNNFPPQIICINNPLVYDHSATDADGDSLSYEFCVAYKGGSASDAKPVPSPPPYDSVQYVAGFSSRKPMAGAPLIQIHPVTGMITGTPNIQGRFVVTVCCHEWRNGININTVKREFQFVVTNCSKAVVANIPQYSDEFNTYIINCEDNTVHFDNISVGGFSYFWDFGVPGVEDDTSDAFDPTYTYPDTGTYAVKLVVNKGSTCPDSIMRLVKIYPTFNTEWSFTGLQCPDKEIQFLDLSESTFKPINNWEWHFGDGTTSASQNPVHRYDAGGDYNVILYSKNNKGCLDSLARTVFIEEFKPFAGNDTIIVRGESINFNASGGVSYRWEPSHFLSSDDINNPVGYFPELGKFKYLVFIKSEYGCEGYDSLEVWVVRQGGVFVPTGFTPNGDGKNELLRPISIGYRNINYFRVFNRWGQQVFYTTQVNEGWDGIWNGVPQDIGTYYWILSITNRFGKDEVIKGDAILIR